MSLETLKFFPLTPRVEVFTKISQEVEDLGYEIIDQDLERPWGGFYRFDNKDVADFNRRFFDDETENDLEINPKILVVAPEARLSWQVHSRRSEEWVVVSGPVDVMLSDTDDEPDIPLTLRTGQRLFIPVGTRHRLMGANNYGVVVERWINIDPKNPSSEDDIRRIQDDYGRES